MYIILLLLLILRIPITVAIFSEENDDSNYKLIKKVQKKQ